MRNQLTFISAAIVAASFSMTSNADVSIYGKAFVTLENYDNGSGAITETKSNASRIGLKGSEKLTDELEAVYKFEREVDLTGEDSELKPRNSYVGLKGGFGQVVVGIHDTTTKDLSKSLDLFNDMTGDYKNVIEGETRAKNMVKYSAPKFNNISLNFMAIADETSENKSLSDSLSMSATYAKDGLTLGLSQDINVKSGSFKKDYLDITRVMASYSANGLTVGGFVQQASEGDSFVGQYDRDSFHVSASYKLDNGWVLKAQHSSGSDNLSTEKSDMTSVGADYKFNKNTKALLMFTTFEQTKNGAVSKEFDSVGLGIEFKF
jgi:predicted porin